MFPRSTQTYRVIMSKKEFSVINTVDKDAEYVLFNTLL